jgi:hypothetical protein
MPLAPNENFNLYNFRNTIGDPARPFLFIVHIPEIGTDTIVTAMARSTTLPALNIGTIPIPFQGVNIKIGGTPEIADWTVNFLCDEAHELRRLFLKWQTLEYDLGTGLVGHSHTYKSDQLGVAQLARNGEQVARYGMVGAFPKTVGDIAVGHDQNGTVETFDVTFSIDYFILVDQFGGQTRQDSFVQNTRSVQINRGTQPPGGNWKTPFNPQ